MDYSYQITAADIVLKNALSNKYLASILAACPGSGKTTVSHYVINNYLKMFPKARVLVLTEGQNVLANQYLSELVNPNIPINFSFGPIGSDVQVEVGIPQSINKRSQDTYNLLIIDEALNY